MDRDRAPALERGRAAAAAGVHGGGRRGGVGRTMERWRLNDSSKVIRLFCSDLDGTLVGNPEASRRFAKVWTSMPESRCPILCYASGRLLSQVLDLLPRAGLPLPDYVLAGVGTEIYDVRARSVLKEMTSMFGDGWDR